MSELAEKISELEAETGKTYSEKEKTFALEFARTHNKSEAARQAGVPDISAAQRGRDMAQDPKIKALVDEINKYQTVKVTKEFIANGLMKEAIEATNSRDRREALHLLGKTQTMFTDGVSQVNADKIPDEQLVEQVRGLFGDEAADKAKDQLGIDDG